MPTNKLFKIAGWCALVIVMLNAADFAFFPSGKPTVIELILEIISLLGLTFVFYALYVAHRSESAGLSLAGLILWFPALGVNLAILGNSGNTFLYNLGTLLFSLPFLIFGFLAYRSTRIPRGLAVVALLSGVSFLIAGVAGFLGSTTIGGVGNLAALVFMLVWAVWLWLVFLSKKFNTASPEPVAA